MNQQQGRAPMPVEMQKCESLFCTMVHEDNGIARCKFCHKQWTYNEYEPLKWEYEYIEKEHP